MPGGKTARADDFDSPGILANEYRSAVAVITMTHRVEDSLAHHALVEGRNIPDEEPLLEVLQVIAQIDKTPDLVEHGKESLPELVSIGCWSRRFVGAVLEDHFCLGKMSSQGFALALTG